MVTTNVGADGTVSGNAKPIVDESGHAVAQRDVEMDLQDLDQQYAALVAAGLPSGCWHDFFLKKLGVVSLHQQGIIRNANQLLSSL